MAKTTVINRIRVENLAASIGISPTTSRAEVEIYCKALEPLTHEAPDAKDPDDEDQYIVSSDHSKGRFIVKILGLPKPKDRNVIDRSFFVSLAKKLKHYHIRDYRIKYNKVVKGLVPVPYRETVIPCEAETDYRLAFSYIVTQHSNGILSIEFIPSTAFKPFWVNEDNTPAERMSNSDILYAMDHDVLKPYVKHIIDFLHSMSKTHKDVFRPYDENDI